MVVVTQKKNGGINIFFFVVFVDAVIGVEVYAVAVAGGGGGEGEVGITRKVIPDVWDNCGREHNTCWFHPCCLGFDCDWPHCKTHSFPFSP